MKEKKLIITSLLNVAIMLFLGCQPIPKEAVKARTDVEFNFLKENLNIEAKETKKLYSIIWSYTKKELILRKKIERNTAPQKAQKLNNKLVAITKKKQQLIKAQLNSQQAIKYAKMLKKQNQLEEHQGVFKNGKNEGKKHRNNNN